jgi:hypothetical protein
MTDDEKERNWKNLPRAIKTIVYEQLRVATCKYAKDAAMAKVLIGLAAGGREAEISALEETNLLIMEGFHLAIDELESTDPDICPDCGGYHDPKEPTVHPKDLS